MDNELSWDHLRHFAAVVKAGTVVGAARTLGVSHATVLRNISRLEGCLGMRLFDRIQSGYRVTTEGEEIYVNALAMEEQAETLLRRAMGQHPAPEGLLKLVVSDCALVDLMPLLREFRREFPRIELSIGPVEDLADGIAQRSIDVAIVMTNTPPEDLVGRQLSRIGFACYASPEYLQERQTVTPKPEECDWITWGATGSGDIGPEFSWQRPMLRRLVPHQNVALHTVDHRDALDAVREGVGASLLRDTLCEQLVRLPFHAASESVGVWMLTHPDLRRAGRVKVFMDFVASSFVA